MPAKPTRTSDAAKRQARLRDAQAQAGLCQVNLVVPIRHRADLNHLAAMLRGDADLSVGPMRRVSTGRLVALGA
jgi:hypothetical protein